VGKTSEDVICLPNNFKLPCNKIKKMRLKGKLSTGNKHMTRVTPDPQCRYPNRKTTEHVTEAQIQKGGAFKYIHLQ
jgi:hypothetical protein